MTTPLAIGVLVSGSGTNLQAIIDQCEAGTIPGRVVCVISNRADAYALQRAEKHGIAARHVTHRDYSSRDEYDAELVAILREYGVGLVILAGFMRIVTPVLLDAFPHAVMNIHPALLPSFPGLHAQQQALDYGVKISGCTVHFVDAGCDTGPIIIQAVVPVLTGDDEATLSARIHREEHRIYPEAVRLFANNCLKVEGRQVRITTPQ
jgi:phosphoribosylglycinamide formyltransferase 1